MYLLLLLPFLISCGGDKPQPPDPKLSFTVTGKHVVVQGRVKPGTKTNVETAKKSVTSAVNWLDTMEQK
jgi:hypothetical protein